MTQHMDTTSYTFHVAAANTTPPSRILLFAFVAGPTFPCAKFHSFVGYAAPLSRISSFSPRILTEDSTPSPGDLPFSRELTPWPGIATFCWKFHPFAEDFNFSPGILTFRRRLHLFVGNSMPLRILLFWQGIRSFVGNSLPSPRILPLHRRIQSL